MISKKTLAGAGATYAVWKLLDKQFGVGNDISTLRRLYPLLTQTDKLLPHHTMGDTWENTVSLHSQKPCIISTETGKSYTFQQVDEIGARIAYHFREVLGYKAGDVVALFMENRPEFVFVLVGLCKAGITTAFINSNNKTKPLLHSIEVANCKAMIYGAELEDAIKDVFPELSNIQLMSCDDVEITAQLGVPRLEDAMNGNQSPKTEKYRENAGLDSAFGYIYTSGTTGLPKACVITNAKMFSTSLSSQMFGVTSNDVGYTCLPLYHSAGLCIGFGSCLQAGTTLVLSRKFSVRKFMKECADYKATFTQYIGELCRYLLNGPETEWDRKHQLRIAIGNGLRREIWVQFQERFNIPEIGEFYGATEGNIAFANHCKGVLDGNLEMVGSVGKYGYMLQKMLKFKLVKHDVENEIPVRDPKTGLCIECKSGEAGELLGFINPARKAQNFKGYTSKDATEKKILRNVLQEGDEYFRTGDLMKVDSEGRVYFVDRIGDTFRWKGENVSTGEVSEVISILPSILEANVYGVTVPGNEDGRAPMAALVANEGKEIDMVELSKTLHKNLASYAIPLFVRILPTMEITGTFKHRKVELVKEGIDLASVNDPLYYLDTTTKEYKVLDAQSISQVVKPRSKL